MKTQITFIESSIYLKKVEYVEYKTKQRPNQTLRKQKQNKKKGKNYLGTLTILLFKFYIYLFIFMVTREKRQSIQSVLCQIITILILSIIYVKARRTGLATFIGTAVMALKNGPTSPAKLDRPLKITTTTTSKTPGKQTWAAIRLQLLWKAVKIL